MDDLATQLTESRMNTDFGTLPSQSWSPAKLKAWRSDWRRVVDFRMRAAMIYSRLRNQQREEYRLHHVARRRL
jgi:hypothetical protein